MKRAAGADHGRMRRRIAGRFSEIGQIAAAQMYTATGPKERLLVGRPARTSPRDEDPADTLRLGIAQAEHHAAIRITACPSAGRAASRFGLGTMDMERVRDERDSDARVVLRPRLGDIGEN